MRTSLRLLSLSFLACASAFGGSAMADASVARHDSVVTVSHATTAAPAAAVIPVKCKNPVDCSAT